MLMVIGRAIAVVASIAEIKAGRASQTIKIELKIAPKIIGK